jgi:hypothetical protein
MVRFLLSWGESDIIHSIGHANRLGTTIIVALSVAIIGIRSAPGKPQSEEPQQSFHMPIINRKTLPCLAGVAMACLPLVASAHLCWISQVSQREDQIIVQFAPRGHFMVAFKETAIGAEWRHCQIHDGTLVCPRQKAQPALTLKAGQEAQVMQSHHDSCHLRGFSQHGKLMLEAKSHFQLNGTAGDNKTELIEAKPETEAPSAATEAGAPEPRR